MPVFEYRGLDKGGRSVRGTIDAENVRVAKVKLKKDSIFVTDLKDKARAAQKSKSGKSTARQKSVNVRDLSMMTRQLASLLKANVPLVDSLSAVADQTENPYLATVMAEIKNAVNEGSALYKALQKYPKIFDVMYVSMVEAGEMSGSLDIILLRLSEFKEAQTALASKVMSALMYPLLMIVFTLLLLGILFIYVVPKIVAVFESSPELTLPWYTVLIIGISGFLVNYWHVIIVTGIIAYLIFQNWKKSENGRPAWDAIYLKLPIVGKISRMVSVSRFTRTLATLLNGGVPMLTAMGIVRDVVDNEVIARAIDVGRENISEGESIAGPLKKSGQFPPIVIHMINIGEKTGELENMLTQVSDAYDFQVNTQVEGLTSVLAPIMIVVMGGVIGVIVFAIMVPMFQLSNLGG
jgi:general secretion pathway protein F